MWQGQKRKGEKVRLRTGREKDTARCSRWFFSYVWGNYLSGHIRTAQLIPSVQIMWLIINYHQLTQVVLTVPKLKRPARSYASLTAGPVCLHLPAYADVRIINGAESVVGWLAFLSSFRRFYTLWFFEGFPCCINIVTYDAKFVCPCIHILHFYIVCLSDGQWFEMPNTLPAAYEYGPNTPLLLFCLPLFRHNSPNISPVSGRRPPSNDFLWQVALGGDLFVVSYLCLFVSFVVFIFVIARNYIQTKAFYFSVAVSSLSPGFRYV